LAIKATTTHSSQPELPKFNDEAIHKSSKAVEASKAVLSCLIRQLPLDQKVLGRTSSISKVVRYRHGNNLLLPFAHNSESSQANEVAVHGVAFSPQPVWTAV
jgi:hypothetical protein